MKLNQFDELSAAEIALDWARKTSPSNANAHQVVDRAKLYYSLVYNYYRDVLTSRVEGSIHLDESLDI